MPGFSALLLSLPLSLAAPARSLAAPGKTAAETRKGDAGSAARKPTERKAKVPRLSAARIVEKHAEARGGLEAWGAVQTLSLSGKMDAGAGDSMARSMRVVRSSSMNRKMRREVAANPPGAEEEKQVQLPFKLARQRPNKSRLEIEFAGKTAVQVYDGTAGWKVRPYLNRNDVEPFTEQEKKSIEAENSDIDDPLMASTAKGTKVELAGVEKVQGRDAYKLKLTLKNGTVRHIWIDAKSFLDVKIEGAPRRMDGRMRNVWVYQSDFRKVQGLMIPFALETAVDGYPQTHKIAVDKVAVNPKLDAATFSKPKA